MDNNIVEPGTWKLLEGTDIIFSMGKNGTLGTRIATIAYNDKATANLICKAVNNYDSLLEALKEINETYRGITDLYMNPSQKAAHKKVNDTLIAIEKAEK